MTPEEFPDDVQALCDICHTFGARGWCQATSGNFSARVDQAHCLITRSGRDKSRLQPADLMICDLHGRAEDPDCKPSAETALHTILYRQDNSIGAVLHTHSVYSTLLSRHGGAELEFTGFEMQKAIAGIESHEQKVAIRIFENDQNMDRLADEVLTALNDGQLIVPGFLIAGHGLYAWGKNSAEAERHTEGFEFLFECRWQETLARLA